MLVIVVASNIISGIVANDSRVDVPTHWAEYPGAVSYSSANILVALAEGIADTAVMKSTQKSDTPISFKTTAKNTGIMSSLNRQR